MKVKKISVMIAILLSTLIIFNEKVNAEVIARNSQNPTWIYYGANAELIDTTQNSCIEGKTKAQISNLMPLNNNTPNSGSIFKSGMSGGIKTSEFYTEDEDKIKSIYNIQLGIRPPSDTYWLTQGTYTYYINVLISTGRRGIAQNWEGYPINDGSLLEGINYSSRKYWSFQTRNQTTDSLTFKTNENNPNSNMVWLTYKVTYKIEAPIVQSWGLGFNIFIPTTSYIYCKSGSNGNESTPGSSGGGHSGAGRHDNDMGATNWFYVNDYIVEKGTHDETLLTFEYEGVDDTGYWSNEEYKNPYQEESSDPTEDINDKINKMEELESELKDLIGIDDVEIPNVQVNTNASSFIWSTITSILQSRLKLMVLITSILTIGLIKLILNR